MISFICYKKIGLALAFFIGLFCLPLFVAQAQSSPEIWMTWRAGSYIPTEFIGKAMPSEGTLVTASFELVDRGRFANLSGHSIYWYLNNELIKTGLGGQQVSFRVPARGSYQLRAVVNNYNGVDVMKTIEIPAVRPEAVIVSLYPRDIFSASRIQVRAVPYFFNTTRSENLNVSWSVNGQKPASTENIRFLDVSLASETADGFPLDIRLSISQPSDFLLGGSDSKTLIFRK